MTSRFKQPMWIVPLMIAGLVALFGWWGNHELRRTIEQQLQASSGLSNADYTVLAVLSEAPEGRPPMKFSQSSRTGPHRRSNAAARRSERSSRSPW